MPEKPYFLPLWIILIRQHTCLDNTFIANILLFPGVLDFNMAVLFLLLSGISNMLANYRDWLVGGEQQITNERLGCREVTKSADRPDNDKVKECRNTDQNSWKSHPKLGGRPFLPNLLEEGWIKVPDLFISVKKNWHYLARDV